MVVEMTVAINIECFKPHLHVNFSTIYSMKIFCQALKSIFGLHLNEKKTISARTSNSIFQKENMTVWFPSLKSNKLNHTP